MLGYLTNILQAASILILKWIDQTDHKRGLIIPVLVSSPNLGHFVRCEICLPTMTPLLPCRLLLHHFISCLSFSCFW